MQSLILGLGLLAAHPLPPSGAPRLTVAISDAAGLDVVSVAELGQQVVVDLERRGVPARVVVRQLRPECARDAACVCEAMGGERVLLLSLLRVASVIQVEATLMLRRQATPELDTTAALPADTSGSEPLSAMLDSVAAHLATVDAQEARDALALESLPPSPPPPLLLQAAAEPPVSTAAVWAVLGATAAAAVAAGLLLGLAPSEAELDRKFDAYHTLGTGRHHLKVATRLHNVMVYGGWTFAGVTLLAGATSVVLFIASVPGDVPGAPTTTAGVNGRF